MNLSRGAFFRIAGVLTLVVLLSGVCWAEIKLDYRQRQAVQRQEWNMKDVEKKIAAGISGEQVQWTLNKLNAIIADLKKNNCPDDNNQVASLKKRVDQARTALGGAEATASEPASQKPAQESPPAVTASSPKPAATAPAAEVKLPYNVREALKRQERNLADFEKKVTEGKTGAYANQLDSMVADLRKNKAPENHSKIKSFMDRVEKARAAFAAAPAPLNRNAKEAVGRQWARVQQVAATLRQLETDIKAAPVIKKWDDRGVTFSLSGIEGDLDRNGTPKDHPHYRKIVKGKVAILARLEELKALAQPKIDAYTSSVSLDNFPEVNEDLERADDLAHLYQNVAVSNLKNPAKAKRFLGPADQIEKFIADSRMKYAPLIENNIQPGRSLEFKLDWLEGNFEKFKRVRQDFDQQAPGEIRGMLAQAEGSMSMAMERKNPQIFTGAVSQTMERARGLLQSLALSVGEDAPVVAELAKAIVASQKKSDETAKALEEEILAETRAPEDKYEGSDGPKLIKKIRDAWHKENPGDEIMDVRIVTPDWERNISWDYNAAGVWYKSDKEFLGFIVIVKTDTKIATIYPAFINRDNLKKRESTVTSHKSTYVIRRMLAKNVK